jgi:hypothetical protein
MEVPLGIERGFAGSRHWLNYDNNGRISLPEGTVALLVISRSRASDQQPGFLRYLMAIATGFAPAVTGDPATGVSVPVLLLKANSAMPPPLLAPPERLWLPELTTKTLFPVESKLTAEGRALLWLALVAKGEPAMALPIAPLKVFIG